MLETKGLTIGQVAKKLGVSASSLRNWEQNGLIPRARRNTLRKVRIYTEPQVKQIEEFIRENYWIRLCFCSLKGAGTSSPLFIWGVIELGEKQINKSSKNQRNTQIKVVTNWQYVEESSPAFRRLMMLLLKPRVEETNGKSTTWEWLYHDAEWAHRSNS